MKYIIISLFLICWIKVDSQEWSDSIIINLSTKEFDNWIEAKYFNIDNSNIEDYALKIETLLKQRLTKGVYTSDDAVFTGIKFFLQLDNLNKSDGSPFYYRNTIDFIDSDLLNLLYKRYSLKAKLLEKRAYLSSNHSLVDTTLDSISINSYQSAVSILEMEKMETDSLLYGSYLKMGYFFLQKEGNKEKADEYFIKVLQYPFYSLTNIENFNFNFHRTLYIEAGLGRIELNKGNLKGLRNLYFIPSTQSELYPLLKEYIENLGGNWDRNSAENSILKIRN